MFPFIDGNSVFAIWLRINILAHCRKLYPAYASYVQRTRGSFKGACCNARMSADLPGHCPAPTRGHCGKAIKVTGPHRLICSSDTSNCVLTRQRHLFSSAMPLKRSKKESEAIAAWKSALKLNPRYAEAPYSLARALRCTDPEESKRLIERLSELNHDQ